MRPVVLVTGAGGAVGPRIVEALHDAGYGVRTLTRRRSDDPALREVVQVIGDVADPRAAAAAIGSARAVLHLAALLHGRAGDSAGRADYETVNVRGTATVAAAASKAGVARFVLFSTVAVYGPSRDGVHDESSATVPDTVYAETKLEAERIVLRSLDRHGGPFGVVLRVAAVYGSRLKGNYRRLVMALARRRFIGLGPGRNRRTLVYDRDLAQSALLAMENPAAVGRIYNVTDGTTHTVREITEAICDALDRPLPRVMLPVAPVRVVAGLVGAAQRLAQWNAGSISGTLVDKYLEDVAVDGQRIQRELGFTPHFNLRAGWREAIAIMRAEGVL